MGRIDEQNVRTTCNEKKVKNQLREGGTVYVEGRRGGRRKEVMLYRNMVIRGKGKTQAARVKR